MICFTDRYADLRCISILYLKPYYEKTKKENNIRYTKKF